MIKLSRKKIEQLVELDVPGISERDKDEMAIPSYLHPNPLIRWLVWKRYKQIDKLAELSKDMTVLEFGCGIGVFLPTLDDEAGRVYTIDIFPQYAKKLAETLNLNVSFLEDLSDLDDSSLDLVIAAEVMEHLDEPQKYVLEFNRKLKTKGRLIVSGPTENFFYRLGRSLAGFSKKEQYHHMNVDDLAKIIEKGGFRTIKVSRLPFCIPPHLFKILVFEKTG
jgi:2-polyprenyl-3-methyl-5-hydroxy-6-metoxy-1,4-benzoquinol methylase